MLESDCRRDKIENTKRGIHCITCCNPMDGGRHI